MKAILIGRLHEAPQRHLQCLPVLELHILTALVLVVRARLRLVLAVLVLIALLGTVLAARTCFWNLWLLARRRSLIISKSHALEKEPFGHEVTATCRRVEANMIRSVLKGLVVPVAYQERS